MKESLKNVKNNEKMKRNEKKTIEISPKNLEDFIWMSYRYCIGRRTAAANAHASAIADIIFKNPDLLSEFRKEFMAQDIRQSVLDTLRWNKRIRFENNYHWHNTNWDFYALLLVNMSECPCPSEARYVIDMEKRTLSWEKLESTVIDYVDRRASADRPDDMYDDLIVWMKLANALDKSCHKDVTVNVEGKEHTIRCFPYVARTQGEYMLVWASLEKDAGSNITMQGYIIPEMITKIEDVK
jgi:hypothetical protein